MNVTGETCLVDWPRNQQLIKRLGPPTLNQVGSHFRLSLWPWYGRAAPRPHEKQLSETNFVFSLLFIVACDCPWSVGSLFRWVTLSFANSNLVTGQQAPRRWYAACNRVIRPSEVSAGSLVVLGYPRQPRPDQWSEPV